jgi:hypothetical protein
MGILIMTCNKAQPSIRITATVMTLFVMLELKNCKIFVLLLIQITFGDIFGKYSCFQYNNNNLFIYKLYRNVASEKKVKAKYYAKIGLFILNQPK